MKNTNYYIVCDLCKCSRQVATESNIPYGWRQINCPVKEFEDRFVHVCLKCFVKLNDEKPAPDLMTELA